MPFLLRPLRGAREVCDGREREGVRFRDALLGPESDEAVAMTWKLSRRTVAFLRALLLSVLEPKADCGARVW